MRTTIVIEGTAPLSFSRPFQTEPNDPAPRDPGYEETVYTRRLTFNDRGHLCVSRTALKNCLGSTASYLGEKIPGCGNRTYTQLFKSAVVITNDPVVLHNGHPLTKKDISAPGASDKPIATEWVYCHADGKRNSGSRVMRLFPQVNEWTLQVDIEVYDPRITQEVLLRYVTAAGIYNGLGRHRPQKEGDHGRFHIIMVNGEEYQSDEIIAPVEEEEGELVPA